VCSVPYLCDPYDPRKQRIAEIGFQKATLRRRALRLKRPRKRIGQVQVGVVQCFLEALCPSSRKPCEDPVRACASITRVDDEPRRNRGRWRSGVYPLQTPLSQEASQADLGTAARRFHTTPIRQTPGCRETFGLSRGATAVLRRQPIWHLRTFSTSRSGGARFDQRSGVR